MSVADADPSMPTRPDCPRTPAPRRTLSHIHNDGDADPPGFWRNLNALAFVGGCHRVRDKLARQRYPERHTRAVMICPDCNENLDNVALDALCPRCKGQRRSATVFAEPARAVVSVPSPTIVAESNLADGTRETVVSHPERLSTSNSGGGAQTQHFEGRPTQHEENVAEALHRLSDTLNEVAGSRVWREHVGHEDIAVDGTLTSTDGRVLKCQVTRVERRTLPTRGRDGLATAHEDDEALAASVITAIESKLTSADPDIVLVLDANDAPAYTDKPHLADIVRDAVRDRSHLGRWAEVWLVGPTVSRTTRLDPP